MKTSTFSVSRTFYSLLHEVSEKKGCPHRT